MQITREATCKLAPSLFLPFVYRPDSKYLASLTLQLSLWLQGNCYVVVTYILHTTLLHPVTCPPSPATPPSLGEVRAGLSLFFQALGWNPGWPRVTHPASLRPDLDHRPQLLFPLFLSLVHLPGESLEGLQDLALSAQCILQVKEPFPWGVGWGRKVAWARQ